MNKIIKRIFDVIFILIILVLASYFILRAYKIVEVYNVKTGSMEDNIHVGDYVLILRKNNYEIGDVITFKRDNYLVTHRIIKKANGLIITKGDANNEEDGPIKYEQIVGKVIIIGGFLNAIIRYKYMLASIFISLYLLSCYLLGDEEPKKEENTPDEIKKEEEIKQPIEQKIEETKAVSDIEEKKPAKKAPAKKTTVKKETTNNKVTEKKTTKTTSTKKTNVKEKQNTKTTTKKTNTSAKKEETKEKKTTSKTTSSKKKTTSQTKKTNKK